MSNEKQPLLDPEKGTVPVLITPGSQIHIAAEVQLPPYYEDGRIRYYATKVWEGVVLWFCFTVLFGIAHAFPHTFPLGNDACEFFKPRLSPTLNLFFKKLLLARSWISSWVFFTFTSLFFLWRFLLQVLSRQEQDLTASYFIRSITECSHEKSTTPCQGTFWQAFDQLPLRYT